MFATWENLWMGPTGRISTLPLIATGLSLMAWRPRTAGEKFVRGLLEMINQRE